eukprot:1993526-Pleurochrysis_carterae.AAC.1
MLRNERSFVFCGDLAKHRTLNLKTMSAAARGRGASSKLFCSSSRNRAAPSARAAKKRISTPKETASESRPRTRLSCPIQ